MIEEVLSFILPQYDLMQLVFLALILTPMFGVVISVWVNAKPRSWQNNWEGGTADDKSDDLDADHGSVNDISHAVATKSERLAEIMPGILLIIGLLGTFLGLGMALNKASNILTQASAMSSGMENSMGDLMGMMHGLGTKFKTSTWGIMGFLLLKAWATWDGFEERRLRWAIIKIKNELDKVRAIKSQELKNRDNQIFQSINKISQVLITTIDNGFLRNQTTLQQELLSVQKLTGESNALLTRQIEVGSESKDLLVKSIADDEKSQAALQDELARLQKLTGESNALLTRQIEVGSESKDLLVKSIADDEKSQAALRAELVRLQKLTGDSNGLLTRQIEVGSESKELLSEFILGNKSNQESIRLSAADMGSAAKNAGIAATGLSSAVSSFESSVSSVLEKMQSDLGLTISKMSSTFDSGMAEMTGNLKNATEGIAESLTGLSSDVKTTMDQVDISINKSMEMQTKAQVHFIDTSDVLNQGVGEMINLVNKLSDDIKSGLKAVSESGRRMVSLDGRYQEITKASEMAAQSLDNIQNEFDVTLRGLQTNFGQYEEIIDRHMASQVKFSDGFSSHSTELDRLLKELSLSISELNINFNRFNNLNNKSKDEFSA